MKTRKLVLTGLLAALGFVLTPFLRIPGVCAPMQHFINVIAAVFLGPWYGLLCAALLTFLKILLMGVDLMSITGGCIGAFLSGLLYQRSQKLIGAVGGEIFGTGIIGAVCSYPISAFVYGNGDVALFTYIPIYLVSTTVGAFCAYIFLKAMSRNHTLEKLQRSVSI